MLVQYCTGTLQLILALLDECGRSYSLVGPDRDGQKADRGFRSYTNPECEHTNPFTLHSGPYNCSEIPRRALLDHRAAPRLSGAVPDFPYGESCKFAHKADELRDVRRISTIGRLYPRITMTTTC